MLDPIQTKPPRIIAIANQKGGVGKTTTAINLSAALAEAGLNILLIDLDPQGNASTGMGISPENRNFTTYDLILGEVALTEVIQKTKFDRVRLVAATTDLSSADIELVSSERRSFLLRDALRQAGMAAFHFDFILIDCPPSLNLLTVNALVAADSLLVPLQSEFFALEGLSQLMLTKREICETANPHLRYEGIVLTMYDQRNNLSRQVEADARENLGDIVFSTVIPRNVRVSEAPSFGLPVLHYDSASKGSRAYRGLAAEIMQRNGCGVIAEEDENGG